MRKPSAEKLLRELFRARFEEPAGSVDSLPADGSNRKLFRLVGKKYRAIGVVHPDRLENRAFVQFSRHFRRTGLPVPEIYAEDAKSGLYLEEDLGETTLFQYLCENRNAEGISERALRIYRRVVRILPQFQISAGRGFPYRFCYPRSRFDAQSMLWDLNHFKYYFLQLAHIPFNEQRLEEDFERFSGFLLGADRDFFLYRDFQSRNILIRNGSPAFIDYQGGRRGALHYDIASLLYDAKADLPPELREELLEEYLEAASRLIPLERKKFTRHYPAYVLIRIFQALGAYGLRGFYEKKTHFLQSIPYAVRNLEYLLQTSELPVKLPALLGAVRWMVGSSYLRQFGQASLKLTVRIQSFAYRAGMPADEKGHGGGYVFDCRALPNPGKYARYARLHGKHPGVAAYLQRQPSVRRFLKNAGGLIGQTVQNYQTRNFTDLFVSFGCTGGLHRSVFCAEQLARRLRRQKKVRVELRHLELEKKREGAPS
ncbi:MAG: phosphotransferase [Elusimicrobia bacterium]|nr:phosphotransferase [Elusimicrobiota bacterium]